MIRWRMHLASFLLMTGVSYLIAFYDQFLLLPPGFLMLMFVPALIIEEARRRE